MNSAIKKSISTINSITDPNVIGDVVSQLLSNDLFKDTLISKLGIPDIKHQLTQLENRQDDIEQYSRRNCLKFRGIPEEEKENTDSLIVKACNSILGVMVTEGDISRSHRVGPKSDKYPRDIIVRFLSYRVRASVYDARFLLFTKSVSPTSKSPSSSPRPSPFKLYVNEALTKQRAQIFAKARFLKSAGHISGTWTNDGRIVIRHSNGSKAQVTRLSELDSYPDPPPRDHQRASRSGVRTLASQGDRERRHRSTNNHHRLAASTSSSFAIDTSNNFESLPDE